jgi:uracil-DNA glycosylase
VFRVSASVRVLMISQAPGVRAHVAELPFADASGDRLRGWMGIGKAEFYDVSRVGLMPMGFCYPGTLAGGGDLPPRPECAPAWHERFLALMPAVQLTLLIGGYAQARYLGRGTMTDFVRRYAGHPSIRALPHPSWRTVGWQARNPWFETDVLPDLRALVSELLTLA